ncbi:MAG: SUMF1/EgtB/PvdO family nonheme iron enzyme [FCB group bacterium]|jgi:acyl carrier protein|nr:SUMF1/EgtB/PvdO family nonheme iron enzyme [FCB group bacterium]
MNHPANIGDDLVLKVAERVRHLASESADVAIEKVQLHSRLIQDLGLDSLAMTEFLMAIEDEFGVTVDEDMGKNIFIGQINTVGDVVQAVFTHWGTGTPPRPEWRGLVPETPKVEFAPFTQLGDVLEGPVDRAALYSPLEPNAQGFSQALRTTDGMRCVRVPAARVTLGSGESDADADQRPRHEADLSAFLMDAEPVSNLAYARFLNTLGQAADAVVGEWVGVAPGDRRIEHFQLQKRRGKWEPVRGTERHPLILVSWFGANAYSLWANGLDWRYFRGDGSIPETLKAVPVDAPSPAAATLYSMLPSEAQWEYAARGKDYARFPWGESEPAFANARVALHRIGIGYEQDALPTLPVHARAGMSPFGLHHMGGNVWQWCRDWYAPDFYSSARATEPDPQNAVPTGIRSERGGSWVGPACLARSSYRRGRTPDARGRCLGFRCIGVAPEAGASIK